jgi:hypothetical protein
MANLASVCHKTISSRTGFFQELENRKGKAKGKKRRGGHNLSSGQMKEEGLDLSPPKKMKSSSLFSSPQIHLPWPK